MNVYFISGLGANERAFERIRLPSQYTMRHLPWIKPLKGESMAGYAKRLSEPIDQTRSFALVGLSMGGMIAAAMNEFLRPQKTILISSVSSAAELPAYFTWCGRLQLHKLLPTSILGKPTHLAYWLFGAKKATEKQLMKHIITNSDPGFIKWGIGAILTWKGNGKPANIFHIHGSKDKILPVRYTKPDAIVKGGSHFMVWTKAAAVSRLLEDCLKSCVTVSTDQPTR